MKTAILLTLSLLIYSSAFANGFQTLNGGGFDVGIQPTFRGDWNNPDMPEMFDGGSTYEGLRQDSATPNGLTLPDDIPLAPHCSTPEEIIGEFTQDSFSFYDGTPSQLMGDLPYDVTNCAGDINPTMFNNMFTDEPGELSLEEKQILEGLYQYFCTCL